MRSTDYFEQFMEILSQHQPGFGKIVVTYEWGCFGHDRGPGIAYYDRDLAPMEHGGMFGFTRMREASDLFWKFLAEDPALFHSRKVLADGFLANRLEMSIYPDRRVETHWRFDPDKDRQEMEKYKKYLTAEEIAEAEVELAEYMANKGRRRQWGGVTSISHEEPAELTQLLDILTHHMSGEFGRVTVNCSWALTGSSEMGSFRFFDRKMNPVEGHRFEESSSCFDLLSEYLSADPDLIHSRKELLDGFLANRLEMTVYPDRRVEMNWSFDPGMDRLGLEKAKKYMTAEEIAEAETKLAEYMANKGRTRRMLQPAPETAEEEAAPPPVPTAAPSPLGIPDLFEVILSTALRAAPEGWRKVVIDGQVWTETDASGRALNNVSADFQAQMADGSVRQITPQEPIAAMNAFTRLHKELPNLEGKPWRQLRVSYDNDGAEQIAYSFDQGSVWRPE